MYFHSLTATHNDATGVQRSGQPRSINRKRWPAGELNSLLDNPATATSRVFHQYTRLLRLRAEHCAFHPDAAQRVLPLDDGLFGIERVSPDEHEWHDLIEGQNNTIDDDIGLTLQPWQTVCLSIA